jgi:hypothetical protein
MKRDRAFSVVIGVLAFGAAHALVTSSWLRASIAPNPLFRPWFTNSSGAVLLTAGVVALAAAAFAVAAADRRSALRRGVTVGAGAVVGMFAVLLKVGLGTLGPVAFIVGAVVLLAAGTAGGGLSAMFKPGH